MSPSPEHVMPNNTYPRDVTSPGPAQRRFVVPSQRVGNARPTEAPCPKAPEKPDGMGGGQEQPKQEEQ